MQQTDIHHFLKQYFKTNDCEVVQEHPSYLTFQLTIEMDKELMNRPFYWHYVEKTGGTPSPACLTFITDPSFEDKDVKGERIHFGSPRLHQIFASTQKFGSFTHLYESLPSVPSTSKALHPWLGLNVKISYKCDRKRDYIVSLGLHLISGKIVENFQGVLEQQAMSPKISDYCFTLSPLIKPKSGISRLQDYLASAIKQDDHQWAEEARKRWYDDLALLDHFYETAEEVPESYETEKQALQEQYEPTIIIKIVNGGLFYLSEQTASQKFA
ncbi:YqhG family protein [Bacillus sp. CGMCC 1.16541]|uniref:YqhG family protein n=1 Tax=Bacillus sp. CGMCC 1.16541 TaxID=2185143 RepID=UPI000D729904|nr:YqhG family protein [Bacillus sp. CGMCC 1.16541]